MRVTRIMMDMPIVVEVVDEDKQTQKAIEEVFIFFDYVDKTFSTFIKTSEINKINNGLLSRDKASSDVREILRRSEETKQATNGFFDIQSGNNIDPSGIVKGWMIHKAAQLLKTKGYRNYYVEAGGDIEVAGKNKEGVMWRIGIRNPFNRYEQIAVVELSGKGIATSGTAIRGNHIYNPYNRKKKEFSIISLTVIGNNVYEADRFATAAFAMDREGINFIARQKNIEGYMINTKGIATWTEGFEQYLYRQK